jgi:hypothetical protein
MTWTDRTIFEHQQRAGVNELLAVCRIDLLSAGGFVHDCGRAVTLIFAAFTVQLLQVEAAQM